jgi:hypothetical protein
MRRSALVLLLAALPAAATAAPPSATAAPPAADPFAALREPAARVAGQIYEGGALRLLEDLSDSVGARLTGSPGYEQGVRWASDHLRAAGIANVHTESFTVARGWQRGPARARMVAPEARALHVVSMGWSAPTPKGGARGPLLVVHDFAPAVLTPLLAQAHGAIVLVDHRGPPTMSPKTYLDRRKGMVALAEAGALAVLLPAGPHVLDNAVVIGGSGRQAGELSPLPVAALGHEDGQALSRALGRGPVTVELELPNVASGPVQVMNVVGELRGRDRPDEWIVLTAHLDSWDLATGSQDNGSGVVEVVEAARALAALGPRSRSVRFVLFGGEEEGLLGSRAYVAAHTAELGGCVASLNTDNGAGHVKGWKVEGRADVQAGLAPIARGLLAGLGGGELDLKQSGDSDHLAFLLEGIPALDLLVDRAHYDDVHHRSSDTVDKVDAHDLASGAAVLAVTALALAEATGPLAPRLDHAGVAAILKEEGLIDLLRYGKVWQP